MVGVGRIPFGADPGDSIHVFHNPTPKHVSWRIGIVRVYLHVTFYGFGPLFTDVRLSACTFFEVQEHFADNIVIGFARLGGYSIGIVANQRTLVKTKKGEMQFGGVIYSEGGSISMTSSTFSSNSALKGGVIYAKNGTFVSSTNNTFENNTRRYQKQLRKNDPVKRINLILQKKK